MAKGSEPPPRFWTYGGVTVDANRIESVYVAKDRDTWKKKKFYVELKMTSGNVYVLAKERYQGGAERVKDNIMDSLNEFLRDETPA